MKIKGSVCGASSPRLAPKRRSMNNIIHRCGLSLSLSLLLLLISWNRRKNNMNFGLENPSETGLAGHWWNQPQKIFPIRDHKNKILKSATSTSKMRHWVESIASCTCEISFEHQLHCLPVTKWTWRRGIRMAEFVITSHERLSVVRTETIRVGKGK